MPRTKLDLITSVLRDELGVIDLNDTPDSAEYDQGYKIYEALLAKLKDQGFAYWPDNEIPDAVFVDLVSYVGQQLAPGYGIARDLGAQAAYLAEIKSHIGRRTSGEPVKTTFF